MDGPLSKFITTPRAWLLGILLAVLIGVLGAVFHHPMGAILSLLSDDAFYYFRIAQNINDGAGCTFDGIATTNGFHPLWMLCVVAVFGVAGQGLLTPVLAIIVLNLLICAAALILVYRLVDRFVAPGYGAVAAAACLLPNVLTAMTNGLETGLEITLIFILLGFVYRRRALDASASLANTFLLGVLLGVVALCRLDAVFLFLGALAMTAASVALRRTSPKAGIVRFALLGAGFSLMVVPYFAWNFVEFGHLTPISGAVKSTFPSISASALDMSGDKTFGAVAITLLVGVLGALFVTGPPEERNWETLLGSPLALLALACTMHFLNTVLFLAWGVYWWHYALYGVALALAAAKLAHRVTSRRAWLGRLTMIVVSVVFVALGAATQARYLSIKGDQHGGWLEGAEWARDNTPPETVFAINDAGLFAYFSRRPTINLDGKANGYEYLRYLRADRVEDYLTEHHTAFVARLRGRYFDGRSRVTMPRSNQPYAYFLVSEENEVFRSREIPSHVGRVRAAFKTHFYIWKYTPGLRDKTPN